MCARGILSQHVMRSIDIRPAKDLVGKEKNVWSEGYYIMAGNN